MEPSAKSQQSPALTAHLHRGLSRKMAISGLLCPVYVTEVEVIWLDPCFLGKSAWLVITLSSGTGTDMEG